MSRPLVDAPDGTDAQHTTELEHITDVQHAMTSNHTEGATEPSHASAAVLGIPELLVMILSNLTIKDLSHTLSVSKQWNGTILGASALRRALFLEPEQATEYLKFMKGKNQRFYDWSQPVILHAPLVKHASTRVIVDPHPALLGKPGGKHPNHSSDIGIYLSHYGVITSVPTSALLFQPPLNRVIVDYWARPTVIEAPKGVTFGAILMLIEKTQAAAKEAVVRSPKFGGYLFRTADQLSLSIRATQAIPNDSHYVKTARLASAKVEDSTIIDEVEGEST